MYTPLWLIGFLAVGLWACYYYRFGYLELKRNPEKSEREAKQQDNLLDTTIIEPKHANPRLKRWGWRISDSLRRFFADFDRFGLIANECAPIKNSSWRLQELKDTRPGIRRLRIVVTISSSVKSGCAATSASSHSACSSNGDLLPPLGFALTLPVSCQRRHHFTAELGLRREFSAASRRDVPDSTASITRSRRSSEYGFGIDRSPKPESVPQTRSPIDP
jgi:hypothetical protein